MSVEHPAWAHQFRYVIQELEERGHTVKVLAINKDRDLELLDIFNIKYEVISDTSGRTIIDKGIIFLKTTWQIFWISRKFKPDIFIGRASPMLSINNFLFRKTHIIFEDSEPSTFCLFVAKLFTDVIFTTASFTKDLGKKQRRISAYKELFYLHPNYFTPDPGVLSELQLTPEDKFVILRFVAWEAHHDIGQKGLSLDEKRRMVAELKKYGRVFISSESPLPEEFERYRITISLEKIHDLLYYATLLLGDSQTMTTEAAILGTPAIRCNSFVGPNDMGNFTELEKEYDLIYSFEEPDRAIKKALELLEQHDLKEQWAKKRERLLADKIDVTHFMIDFIENYPQSFDRYKKGSWIPL
ncbi:DUF354 domain-containing protein [Chloroflexota bacterium]